MNQHRLIIDRKALERDFDAARAIYTMTYQMTHLSKEKGCLQHDDRIDALELGCSHMVEWIDINQEDGAERYIDEALNIELEKIEQMGMNLFGYEGAPNNNNFGTNF